MPQAPTDAVTTRKTRRASRGDHPPADSGEAASTRRCSVQGGQAIDRADCERVKLGDVGEAPLGGRSCAWTQLVRGGRARPPDEHWELWPSCGRDRDSRCRAGARRSPATSNSKSTGIHLRGDGHEGVARSQLRPPSTTRSCRRPDVAGAAALHAGLLLRALAGLSPVTEAAPSDVYKRYRHLGVRVGGAGPGACRQDDTTLPLRSLARPQHGVRSSSLAPRRAADAAEA